VIVREFQDVDLARVDELMEQQNWVLPPLSDPHFISKVAVTSGNGEGVAFGFVRVIGEAYLVPDKKWATPAWRWEALKLAHNAALADSVAKGLSKAITWTPNSIFRPYSRRLRSLGWEQVDKASFVYEVS